MQAGAGLLADWMRCVCPDEKCRRAANPLLYVTLVQVPLVLKQSHPQRKHMERLMLVLAGEHTAGDGMTVQVRGTGFNGAQKGPSKGD